MEDGTETRGDRGGQSFIDTSEENEVGQVTDDIDWGDPGAMTESAIDFGDEIDFNMADITVETGGTEEGDQNPDTGVTGHDSDSNGIDWTDVVIVDKPDAEGVAKGEDAMSLLDNPRTRTLFIDDLMELEAFLMQRLFELDSDSAGGGCVVKQSDARCPFLPTTPVTRGYQDGQSGPRRHRCI